MDDFERALLITFDFSSAVDAQLKARLRLILSLSSQMRNADDIYIHRHVHQTSSVT